METTEKMQADSKFLDSLETSIKEWKAELQWLEKELVEQALIDSKEGRRSNRYLVLEARERDVKYYLADAESKIDKVAERYGKGPLSTLLNTALTRPR